MSGQSQKNFLLKSLVGWNIYGKIPVGISGQNQKKFLLKSLVRWNIYGKIPVGMSGQSQKNFLLKSLVGWNIYGKIPVGMPGQRQKKASCITFTKTGYQVKWFLDAHSTDSPFTSQEQKLCKTTSKAAAPMLR
jgi:hypothetical protein